MRFLIHTPERTNGAGAQASAPRQEFHSAKASFGGGARRFQLGSTAGGGAASSSGAVPGSANYFSADSKSMPQEDQHPASSSSLSGGGHNPVARADRESAASTSEVSGPEKVKRRVSIHTTPDGSPYKTSSGKKRQQSTPHPAALGVASKREVGGGEAGRPDDDVEMGEASDVHAAEQTSGSVRAKTSGAQPVSARDRAIHGCAQRSPRTVKTRLEEGVGGQAKRPGTSPATRGRGIEGKAQRSPVSVPRGNVKQMVERLNSQERSKRSNPQEQPVARASSGRGGGVLQAGSSAASSSNVVRLTSDGSDARCLSRRNSLDELMRSDPALGAQLQEGKSDVPLSERVRAAWAKSQAQEAAAAANSGVGGTTASATGMKTAAGKATSSSSSSSSSSKPRPAAEATSSAGAHRPAPGGAGLRFGDDSVEADNDNSMLKKAKAQNFFSGARTGASSDASTNPLHPLSNNVSPELEAETYSSPLDDFLPAPLVPGSENHKFVDAREGADGGTMKEECEQRERPPRKGALANSSAPLSASGATSAVHGITRTTGPASGSGFVRKPNAKPPTLLGAGKSASAAALRDGSKPSVGGVPLSWKARQNASGAAHHARGSVSASVAAKKLPGVSVSGASASASSTGAVNRSGSSIFLPPSRARCLSARGTPKAAERNALTKQLPAGPASARGEGCKDAHAPAHLSQGDGEGAAPAQELQETAATSTSSVATVARWNAEAIRRRSAPSGHTAATKHFLRLNASTDTSVHNSFQKLHSSHLSGDQHQSVKKFRARPAPASTYQVGFPLRKPSSLEREPLELHPFNLQTDARGEKQRQKIEELRQSLLQREEAEVALANGFKARPVGDYADKGITIVERRPPTEFKPFRLSSRPNTPRRESPENAASAERFRARPLPSTTFQPGELPQRNSFVPTKPVSPRLSVGSAKPPAAACFAAEQAAETKFKAMPMPDFDHVKFEVKKVDYELTDTRDPNLNTEHRGLKRLVKFEERRRSLLEERELQETPVPFRARPIANYADQFMNRQVEMRPRTQPEPFQLSESRKRPNLHGGTTSQEPEFRARPLPKTTYEPMAFPEKKQLSATTAEPFKLHSNEDLHTLKRFIAKKEEEERMKKDAKEPYKAQPAPTFEHPFKPTLSTKSLASEKVEEFKLSSSNFSKKPKPEEYDTSFKAKPIRHEDYAQKWVSASVERRPVTDPQPFKGLEERRSLTPRRRTYVEEEPKPFKARPIPSAVFRPSLPKPPSSDIAGAGESNRRRTLPVEIHLHSDRQAAKREEFEREKQKRLAEEERKKEALLREKEERERQELLLERKQLEFKARPMPEYRCTLPVVEKPPLTEPIDTRLYTGRKYSAGAEQQDSTTSRTTMNRSVERRASPRVASSAAGGVGGGGGGLIGGGAGTAAPAEGSAQASADASATAAGGAAAASASIGTGTDSKLLDTVNCTSEAPAGFTAISSSCARSGSSSSSTATSSLGSSSANKLRIGPGGNRFLKMNTSTGSSVGASSSHQSLHEKRTATSSAKTRTSTYPFAVPSQNSRIPTTNAKPKQGGPPFNHRPPSARSNLLASREEHPVLKPRVSVKEGRGVGVQHARSVASGGAPRGPAGGPTVGSAGTSVVAPANGPGNAFLSGRTGLANKAGSTTAAFSLNSNAQSASSSQNEKVPPLPLHQGLGGDAALRNDVPENKENVLIPHQEASVAHEAGTNNNRSTTAAAAATPGGLNSTAGAPLGSSRTALHHADVAKNEYSDFVQRVAPLSERRDGNNFKRSMLGSAGRSAKHNKPDTVFTPPEKRQRTGGAAADGPSVFGERVVHDDGGKTVSDGKMKVNTRSSAAPAAEDGLPFRSPEEGKSSDGAAAQPSLGSALDNKETTAGQGGAIGAGGGGPQGELSADIASLIRRPAGDEPYDLVTRPTFDHEDQRVDLDEFSEI